MLQRSVSVRWLTRHRVRTLCLSLACVSVLLHLLLVALTFSAYQTPCESPLHPHIQNPKGHRGQTGGPNPPFSSGGSSSDSLQYPDSSSRGNPGEDSKAHDTGSGPANVFNLKVGPDKPMPINTSLIQFRALLAHPLYNQTKKPAQEEDWLLRVKQKTQEHELDSPQWLSAGEDGYDAVQLNEDIETHPPWLRFHLGITRWHLYHHDDPTLQQLEQQLASHKIVSAVQKTGGTQLKLLMSFPNYGQALLKPMKQERNEETNYNLYYFSDFERHNAEIAAYHLDRVLGFRRVPPVVGRLIDVTKEIKDITTDRKLAKTFFNSPVGNVCFYGQCSYYCSTEHAVCARPNLLEASLAAMLPDISLASRRSWRSPWRRSYSRSKLALWEKDKDYCDMVKKTPPYNEGTRLVDVVDMAILDFLMSNMDRHHYETFEKFGNDTFLLHLDNGRAFGRYSKDEPSILAPLEQCCRIRRSTWLKLQLLSQPSSRLSDIMRASLSLDPLGAIAPLLSELHLAALDRRLATVISSINHCKDKHNDTIYDDVPNYPG